MFKISPVQDADLSKKYIQDIGGKYIDGAFVYAMTDIETNELLGASQFEITDTYGYIYTLKHANNIDDFEAMFILGRQTMNFIDLCGSHTCRTTIDAGDERLLKAIGFKESENKFLLADMTGMFDGKCDGSCK